MVKFKLYVDYRRLGRMLDLLLKLLGDPNNNKIKKMMPVVEHINALEQEFSQLSDEELRNKTE